MKEKNKIKHKMTYNARTLDISYIKHLFPMDHVKYI